MDLCLQRNFVLMGWPTIQPLELFKKSSKGPKKGAVHHLDVYFGPARLAHYWICGYVVHNWGGGR